MFVEVDVVFAFLSSTTQDTTQKDRSKKRVHSVNPFCFRNLFPAQFNKPLQRALFLDGRCFDKVF